MPRFHSPGREWSPSEIAVSIRAALATPLALLALAASAAAFQAGAGRIEVLNSRGEVAPLGGTTVLSETLDEVQFRRTGSSRNETRQTPRIVKIVYGAGSATLEQARAAVEAGDVREAVALYTAASNESDPPWMASHVLLELAELHASQGKDSLAQARASVQRFLDGYPEHRMLPQALLAMATYAAGLGDATAADDSVRAVLDLARDGRITADWTPRAHLTLGRALLEAGDAAKAATSFSAAEQSASAARRALADRADLQTDVDELALAARSGTGAAMLVGGDVSGARNYFRQLLSDGSGDGHIVAAATNGLAEADFLEEKLKDAQVGFARVAVTAAGTPEEHAKALYYLGRCSDALADAGKERTGRTSARTYYQEVLARYPASHWARLAQQNLP
jgi:TolA-binding protein